MYVVFIIAGIAVLFLLLAMLPTWTPYDLSGAIASMQGHSLFDGLGWLNHYMPVDVALELMAIQLTIWAAVYLVRFVIWLLQLFHVAGGGKA